MEKGVFLGLGVMGTAMAHNILKAGFPLTVYNRTRAKAEPFAAEGARIAKSPREAAQLKVVVGGDPVALERAQPVLAAVSQQIEYMGVSGSGAMMKLINNLMVATQAVGLAEGLTLASRAELNMEQVVTDHTAVIEALRR
jgi:3-hydroxyisobutyrate dehydrogenase-like beta-hydroxyacid dehydrogenase